MRQFSESEIIDRTRAWVRETFLYASPERMLADDEMMMGSGVIDSVGAVELIEFLQETFGVAIGDSDISERNLGSLAAVARFVYARRQADPAVRTA